MNSPAPVPPLVTADEFENLVEEGYLLELVRGLVVRERAPAPLHGRTQALLAHLLLSWLEPRGAGGAVVTHTGFVVRQDPDTVRLPDVAYVAAGRLPENAYRGRLWRFGPDLAIEVTSPSNTWTELQAKVDDYFAADTRSVWVVDPPSRTITVYRPGVEALRLGEADEVTDETLPDFRLRVGRLFEG